MCVWCGRKISTGSKMIWWWSVGAGGRLHSIRFSWCQMFKQCFCLINNRSFLSQIVTVVDNKLNINSTQSERNVGRWFYNCCFIQFEWFALRVCTLNTSADHRTTNLHLSHRSLIRYNQIFVFPFQITSHGALFFVCVCVCVITFSRWMLFILYRSRNYSWSEVTSDVVIRLHSFISRRKAWLYMSRFYVRCDQFSNDVIIIIIIVVSVNLLRLFRFSQLQWTIHSWLTLLSNE